MTTITERLGKVTGSHSTGKRKAAPLVLGQGDARGDRLAELMAMEQVGVEHMLELNWLVRQGWFDLCSELTDYPRCGKVPDDLRRMHWECIDAVGEAMEALVAGGDVKAALRRLAALGRGNAREHLLRS